MEDRDRETRGAQGALDEASEPKAEFRHGNAIAFFAQSFVPTAVILFARVLHGLPIFSWEPVAIASVFAMVQAGLRVYLLDEARELLRSRGAEAEYWVSAAVLYGLVCLGIIELYELITI